MTWREVGRETVVVELNPSGIYGKQRHRHGMHGSYSSATERAREREIADAFALEVGTKYADWDDEAHLIIFVQKPCAKDTPKYKEGAPDTSAPDCDNVAKLVMDALNGLAWKDDRSVTELCVKKYARYRRDKPYMRIVITYVRNVCEKGR